MCTITLRYLILFTVLIGLIRQGQSTDFDHKKLNRIVRSILPKNLQSSLDTSRIDSSSSPERDKIDKSDRLQSNEQQTNSILMPFELNENVEENTKNVIYWTPENYPNPFVDFKNCSLEKKGYICDPDEILEQEDINKLRQSIEGLNEDLDNHCSQGNGKKGIDFGIAIMDQFQKIENKTLRETANEYAEQLRHKWNLGGQCDNGLLILQSSKASILTYSMGKTTQKLIKNETINALNLNTFIEPTINEENNQPLGQIQNTLIKLSTGLSFVNQDKALKKLDKIVHDNPKIGNAMKNVEATLERQIEEQEKSGLNEINSNDRYNSINSERLLIYFLMFVLMFTIAGFILNVFLKRRLDNSSGQTRNTTSINNSLQNFNTQCAYSGLGEDKKKTIIPENTNRYRNEYVPVSTNTNNNDQQANLNNNSN